MSSSGKVFRQFRLRHGVNRERLAVELGVPASWLAAWERGTAEPDPAAIGKLTDVMRALPSDMLLGLRDSVLASRLPRAVSRGVRLRLQAVSGPAVDKRPSIVDWIGRDLAPIASGVLQEMLDDRELQRAILSREVVGVVSTTRSVLRTEEAERVGLWRTTVHYFVHDGTIFSDAIAVPAMEAERIGYTPILADEICIDLFGDHALLETQLIRRRSRGRA